MSVTVVVTAEAEADIDEAAQQYEQRSAGLGVDFVARVRDALAAVVPTRISMARWTTGFVERRRSDFRTEYSTAGVGIGSK